MPRPRSKKRKGKSHSATTVSVVAEVKDKHRKLRTDLPVPDETCRCSKCGSLFPTRVMMQVHEAKCVQFSMTPTDMRLTERRRIVQELLLRGLSVAAIAKGLSVVPNVIFEDIKAIKKENLDLLKTQKVQDVVAEEIAKIKHMEEAIRTDYFSVGQDTAARYAANRGWLETWTRMMEVWQKLGLFPANAIEYKELLGRPNLQGIDLAELQRRYDDVDKKQKAVMDEMKVILESAENGEEAVK